MPRSYKYRYMVAIQKETQPVLAEIAEALGFVSDAPGAMYGAPSPASLLDALANAYRDDPTAVTAALAPLLNPQTDDAQV